MKDDGRRDKLVAVIDRSWRENYCSPTLREMVDGSGYRSTSVVSYWLRKLVKEGVLVRCGGNRRGEFVPMWVKESIDYGISKGIMTDADGSHALAVWSGSSGEMRGGSRSVPFEEVLADNMKYLEFRTEYEKAKAAGEVNVIRVGDRVADIGGTSSVMRFNDDTSEISGWKLENVKAATDEEMQESSRRLVQAIAEGDGSKPEDGA